MPAVQLNEPEEPEVTLNVNLNTDMVERIDIMSVMSQTNSSQLG